jgi:hypothetical protein
MNSFVARLITVLLIFVSYETTLYLAMKMQERSIEKWGVAQHSSANFVSSFPILLGVLLLAALSALSVYLVKVFLKKEYSSLLPAGFVAYFIFVLLLVMKIGF